MLFLSSYFGDGNDIEVSLHSNFVKLIYKHGSGDCPSGCIYNDFFIFKVYNNCSVEFVGTSQLSLTDKESYPSISIFPNPVTSSFQISNVSKESESESEFEIY